MQVPLEDVLLKYIATQGPFKETTADFWQMVWETGAHIVVMLTQCQVIIPHHFVDIFC